MKKIFLLLILALFVTGFSACTKRDRLLDNAMVLQIEPAGDITLNIGDGKTLTAIVKNTKFEEVSHGIRWSVSDSNLGSFSSTTEKTTTFTAEAAGTGTITLSCQGYSVTAKLTVS